ncbi:DUF1349 domain-containing protein [Paenibacillus filicis]|uniref:DUF1349 domain-containing protein n=1 Tax=Paenibacillus filicis TaxID=669464 RepID=A0ABU9DFH6_9BACL
MSENPKHDVRIFDRFTWTNVPRSHAFLNDQTLLIETEPQTDFWQRTSYGFRRDNGHSLLTRVEGDFVLTARFEFSPVYLYDQCGLLVRLDEENWIKASTEYENADISRLGSVVTNLGYSDWATTDISSEIRTMHYRISRKGQDFIIESSYQGVEWMQMRMAHLHRETESLQVGVYACSPQNSSFKCQVDRLVLEEAAN